MRLCVTKYLLLRFKLKPLKEKKIKMNFDNWLKKSSGIYTISTLHNECSKALIENTSQLALNENLIKTNGYCTIAINEN